MRGGGGGVPEPEVDKPFQNFYCTFGCPANDGVKLNSTLSESFVKCARQNIIHNAGVYRVHDSFKNLKKHFEPAVETT